MGKTTRREFVRTTGAGAVGASPARGSPHVPPRMSASDGPYDVVVVGAGVFGAWTAYMLASQGRRVAILDAYGPGNARASSGGSTRAIRMGYGDQEIYTRWAMRSLGLWKSLATPAGAPPVFQQAGVLWIARGEDPLTTKTLAALHKLGVVHERLDRAELDRRWPQIAFAPEAWAILEPESGFLLAFHAVQTVVRLARAEGADYFQESVLPQNGSSRMTSVETRSGKRIAAGEFVFACGPWLPKVFPELLGDRIFPTRQEVFFFGPPSGDARFQSPAMPVWMDFGEEIYGLPDFEGRGFKVAPDRHGPAFDPDTGARIVTSETLARVREFVGRRFPALKDAPVVLGEVCQYENTSNGDFLIDRHPEQDNVWLVGGGSGHGFKHGPAVGEYVAERIAKGGPVEHRFSLATKEKIQNRAVY